MVHAAMATTTSYEDVGGAPRCREMALMPDLRDAREVVRRLDEALQRLADDMGVPAEVVALVSEIETALVDTGPLEIGVSAAGFVGALETSRRIRASLGAADAVTQHCQIVRFLRELRRLFRRAAASARARDRAPGVRRAIRVGLFACLAAGIAETNARAITVVAGPGERLLLCLRPVNIGNLLRRRVLIATDRRLFLADRGRGSRPVRLVRSVEYPQITALSCGEAGEYTRLELRVGSGVFEQLDLRLATADAKALLAILCRRAGLPAPPPASGYIDWRNNIDRLLWRGRGL
jgi:hypothetical protein